MLFFMCEIDILIYYYYYRDEWRDIKRVFVKLYRDVLKLDRSSSLSIADIKLTRAR